MKYFILLLSFPLFAQTQYEVVPEKYWITDSNFEEKVNKENAFEDDSSEIVVVEFWAKFNQDNCFRDWDKLKGVTYHRVDVSLAPLSKKKYRIRMAPTVLVFKNGVKELSYKAGLDLLFPSDLSEIQEDIYNLKKESKF
tara:strand:- start:820 stop:1236 length:417 start_codon:yes stop_codon:yes gene_type:complete